MAVKQDSFFLGNSHPSVCVCVCICICIWIWICISDKQDFQKCQRYRGILRSRMVKERSFSGERSSSVSGSRKSPKQVREGSFKESGKYLSLCLYLCLYLHLFLYSGEWPSKPKAAADGGSFKETGNGNYFPLNFCIGLILLSCNFSALD